MKIFVSTSHFGEHPLPENVQIVRNPLKRRLTGEEISKLLKEQNPDALIAGLEPLTGEALEGCPDLKIISRCGTGTDNVDFDAAERLEIKVFNTPDEPAEAVSEMTLAMILALIKRIAPYDRAVRAGEWECPPGNMLAGKTAGIIGFGRIGERVGRMLNALGCKVVFSNTSPKESNIATQVELETLIRESDIISLHIPYTETNRHLISGREFGMMKKGAFLVNTARGGLVNEDALLVALEKGVLAGAALDCFENEPYEGPLTGREDVLLSPHKGSSAVESRVKMERKALENVLEHLK